MLTWVITGPILAYAVLGPGGRQARRRPRLAPGRTCGASSAVAVFAGLTALAWERRSLIVFRVLGAGVGAATGPASLAMINKLFPPERRAQALGYWSLVGGRRAGHRRGDRRPDRRGVRLAVDLHRPGADDAARAGRRLLRAARDRPPRAHAVRRRRARCCSAPASAPCSSALNRGPAMGWSSPLVVAVFVLCAGAARRRSCWSSADVSHPLIPLRVLPPPQLRLPDRQPVLHQLRLHGRLHRHAVPAARTCSATATAKTGLAVDRPAAGLLHRRARSPATSRCGWGSARTRWSARCSSSASMVALSHGRRRHHRPVDHGRAGPVRHRHGHDLAGHGRGHRQLGRRAGPRRGRRGPADDAQVGVVAGIQILHTVQAAREPVVGGAASYHTAYLVGRGRRRPRRGRARSSCAARAATAPAQRGAPIGRPVGSLRAARPEPSTARRLTAVRRSCP